MEPGTIEFNDVFTRFIETKYQLNMSGQLTRCALFSVSDKSRLDQLAKGLAEIGCEILASGGTSNALRKWGIDTKNVSEYTGFPEIMDGRVKTLHPLIHAGILSRRDEDKETVSPHQIQEIDIVVVNLYPFAETIAKDDCTRSEAIENIDIGGPTLIRAAAKNHEHVLVLVDPADYLESLQRIQSNTIDFEYRHQMATKALRHVANYDKSIAEYFEKERSALEKDQPFPKEMTLRLEQKLKLRYGENPQQKSVLYTVLNTDSTTLASAKLLQGKELSFNNLVDADAALKCIQQFKSSTCVIVKHETPCGVASGENLTQTYRRAYRADPVSAFGGIIAFNEVVSGEVVEEILSNQFVELILAPKFEEPAVQIAKSKESVRLIEVGSLEEARSDPQIKQITGGFLIQDPDDQPYAVTGPRVVTHRSPNLREQEDLKFAWKVAWFVKSNAIVLAQNQQTIGIGTGQPNRVTSVKIAIMNASELPLRDSYKVLASDAFFPFRDSIDEAAEAGVTAVIQPGGSIRDSEVIEAANEHNIAMQFTDTRHFLH